MFVCPWCNPLPEPVAFREVAGRCDATVIVAGRGFEECGDMLCSNCGQCKRNDHHRQEVVV